MAADIPNPNPKRCCDPSEQHFNSNRMDSLLNSFLSLSNSDFDLYFDRLLNSTSDQADSIDGALRSASTLLEVSKRAFKGLSVRHNSSVWPLSSDLTIKIFSLLDTQSLCCAAATCSFLHECAANPACYEDIDLVTAGWKVNDLVVATLIQRAGKEFRSLKLGSTQPLSSSIIRYFEDSAGVLKEETYTITRSCLAPLSSNRGTIGSSIRRLHLCNIKQLDDTSLNKALSVCTSLRDLEILQLNVDFSQIAGSISKSCPLIERLILESSRAGRDCSFKLGSCYALLSNCPNISSLALRGFQLPDVILCVLVQRFHKLKYVDFSTCYTLTGSFLKNLDGNAVQDRLEVLILRDCMNLEEVEVVSFFSAVLAGEFKHLKHIDISNGKSNCSRRLIFFIPFKQLLEARPDLHVLAEVPEECELVNGSSESSF